MMVMIRAMSNVMTFFALLLLFMFTFAILGMPVFGETFTFNEETSPSNFDLFVAAMTTVFQVKFSLKRLCIDTLMIRKMAHRGIIGHRMFASAASLSC